MIKKKLKLKRVLALSIVLCMLLANIATASADECESETVDNHTEVVVEDNSISEVDTVGVSEHKEEVEEAFDESVATDPVPQEDFKQESSDPEVLEDTSEVIEESVTEPQMMSLRTCSQNKQPQVTTYDVTYKWSAVIPEELQYINVDLNSSLASAGLTLPNKVTYRENDPVTVDTTYIPGQTFMDSTNRNYKWVYSGWDKSDSFNITEDTVINGTWTLKVARLEYVTWTIRYLLDGYNIELDPPKTGTVLNGKEFEWYSNGYRETIQDGNETYGFVRADKPLDEKLNLTEDYVVNLYYAERPPVEQVSYEYKMYMEDPNNLGSFTEVREFVYYPGVFGTPPHGNTVDKNTVVSVDTQFSKGLEAHLFYLKSLDDYYYTFTGWDKAPSFTITENTTITGKWELTRVNWTINYLLDGYNIELDSPKTGTVSKGTEFEWYSVGYRDFVEYDNETYCFTRADKPLDEKLNLTEDYVVNLYYVYQAEPPLEKVSYNYKMYIEDPNNLGSFTEITSGVETNTGTKIGEPAGEIVAENTLVTVDTEFTKDLEMQLQYPGTKSYYYYTFTGWDKAPSFTITEDTVITGKWELTRVDWTINYLDYDNNNQLIDPKTGTVLKGEQFNWYTTGYRYSLAVDGYSFIFVDSDDDGDAGESVQLLEDYTVNTYYQLRSNVFVNYLIKDTDTELREHYGTVLSGRGQKFDPSTVKYDTLDYNGKTYVYDSTDIGSLEPIDVVGTVNINLYYTEKVEEIVTTDPPSVTAYTLTQYYKIKDTDVELMDKWESIVEEGNEWKFSGAPETISVDDKVYELVEVTGADSEGTKLSEDLTRTAWYVEKVEEKVPEPTPEGSKDNSEPAPKPEIESHIDAPKTGDNTNIFLYTAVFVIAFGAILVLVYKKHR